MGLPGSGKTTFSKDYESKHFGCTKIVDMDYQIKKRYRDMSLDKLVYRCHMDTLSHSRNANDVVEIFDGLLLSMDDVATVITNVEKSDVDYYDFSKKHLPLEYEIHYWCPDVEACLHNDKGRRTTNSSITIKNAKFEIPTKEGIVERIKINNNIIIQKHNVVRKSDFQVFTDTHNNGKCELVSSKWSNGGTYGNCWDNHLGTISPDKPLEFDEFDELLENISPDISFLKYKKLKAASCRVEETSENDYYGGCEYYSHHVCDLKILYEMLVEMDLLKE